ncbi:MAG: N-6 DNA methylase [Synergistaceae bacterium]|nr:N-6 DNA methylase [Synergistaceae bacterium]
MQFAEMVQERTQKYLQTVSKSERKEIGQFFTPASIADYMSKLAAFKGDYVRVLDPGAGSGILSAALIDNLIGRDVKRIEIDLYENNQSIIPLLESNLQYISEQLQSCGTIFDYHIIDKNFIEENQREWMGWLPSERYDIVVSNPPYKKIGKTAMEASIMSDIVYGQPNLYFLFMAMGAKLLKKNGEFIYIVPRSFSSGLYFSAFRKWFLSEMRIANLHLFVSRGSVGGKHDNVLQETIILKANKTDAQISNIIISESVDEFCAKAINSYKVNYHTCVSNDDNAFLFFPTNEEDAMILGFVNSWNANLPSLGFKMKTGQLVDFRERDWLKKTPGNDTVPLLWAYNFNGQKIRFPVDVPGKPQYLKDEPSTKRLQMNKGNYILLKRFTSKEEKRRLQCVLLFEDDFSEYRSISTENHLNFITKETGKMLPEEMYGLYVVLNSSYLDRYFRILNGSTQVNATEINAIPFPSINAVKKMGMQAMNHSDLGEFLCDSIIEEQFISRQI